MGAALIDKTKITVYVVEDDASVRRSLKMLLSSAGFDVLTFESAEDFLKSEFKDYDACLVTDVKMRGLGGLGLKQKLDARGSKLPVIYITAFDTEEVRVQAKKYGAVGYFRKPVDDQALIDAIRWALRRSTPEKAGKQKP